MKPETLEQFFLEELKDLYDAEKQLVKALPRMAKAATHEELKSAFEEHAQVTQEHLQRLERILNSHEGGGRGRRAEERRAIGQSTRGSPSRRPAVRGSVASRFAVNTGAKPPPPVRKFVVCPW